MIVIQETYMTCTNDTLDIELFFSEYCACMNDYRKIVGGFILYDA